MTYKALDFLILAPLAVAAAFDAKSRRVPRAAANVLVWGGMLAYIWMLAFPGAPFRPLMPAQVWTRPLAALAVAALGYPARRWFGMADTKACFYMALAMYPTAAIAGFVLANVLVVLRAALRAFERRPVPGGKAAFLPYLFVGCLAGTALFAP